MFSVIVAGRAVAKAIDGASRRATTRAPARRAARAASAWMLLVPGSESRDPRVPVLRIPARLLCRSAPSSSHFGLISFPLRARFLSESRAEPLAVQTFQEEPDSSALCPANRNGRVL